MNTPSVAKHRDNAVDDRVHVLDVGKTVRRRDHARGAVLARNLARGLDAEIALDGGDAAAVGDVADVGRLDAEHAVSRRLEIRQQRPVIGADIDDEVVLAEAQHSGGLALQIGEIVAQQFGGAAGVGIFRRENNRRIDGEAELHQIAVRAMQQAGRKPRLLMRDGADRHHLVDRRHEAQRQHRVERLVPANLAGFDRHACASAGGARYFRRTQKHQLRTRHEISRLYTRSRPAKPNSRAAISAGVCGWYRRTCMIMVHL